LTVYRIKEDICKVILANRVLRRIFGPKREEVAGGCKRLQYEELHNLYPAPNIKVIIW
jgi:hypothetical protein